MAEAEDSYRCDPVSETLRAKSRPNKRLGSNWMTLAEDEEGQGD
jgi:hypothetical protein